MKTLEVGICGAGIGGLATGIACARAGTKVTILEQAEEIAEIGAGIQMTPNVSRLLRAWGVADRIGSNLVRHANFNTRHRNGTVLARQKPACLEEATGHPWWVVHRHHLLMGLLETARAHGCTIHTASRVTSINHTAPKKRVHVSTAAGGRYNFDLLIGADGLNSVVRCHLFPAAGPRPLNNNAAYRATLPYSVLRSDPELRSLAEEPNMDVWLGPAGYVISYPISGGETYNIVFSHQRPQPITAPEEIDYHDLVDEYWDFDPRLRKIISLLDARAIRRWPLLQTDLEKWGSEEGNVVLIGDAAHSMVNHMAQGAATSMEDAAFLGTLLRSHVKPPYIPISTLTALYESARRPHARAKQQLSILSGAIWMLPDGPYSIARDAALAPQLRHPDLYLLRSPDLFTDPATVREIWMYDAEAAAGEALREWRETGVLSGGGRRVGEIVDVETGVEKKRADRCLNWFLPGRGGEKGEWRPFRTGGALTRTGFAGRGAEEKMARL